MSVGKKTGGGANMKAFVVRLSELTLFGNAETHIINDINVTSALTTTGTALYVHDDLTTSCRIHQTVVSAVLPYYTQHT